MSVLLSSSNKKAELMLNTSALKKYLKEKNWTLCDLAQRMGISYNMLHLVTKGKRNPGHVFIAGLLSACEEADFNDFFIVVRLDNTDYKKEVAAV